MHLHTQVLTFNAFQENTILVWDEHKNTLIFDPGCYGSREEDTLLRFITENNLKPVALLNTHAHIDHVLGNHFVKSQFNIPFYLHETELKTLNAVAQYAHLYGFEGYKLSTQPDFYVKDGEWLFFGDMACQVRFCPGHSVGHVVYYFEAANFVVNGDVLFQGSFGRVDLPGGDIDTLKNSIFTQMFTLPDETKVFCGHGPETTIGREKKHNYILQF
jgi:glyoxylase-like metal-dependent hydrolase (beta-lactamase superfamily II)